MQRRLDRKADEERVSEAAYMLFVLFGCKIDGRLSFDKAFKDRQISKDRILINLSTTIEAQLSYS